MAGFGDIVQKAFYLGVGMASYATEKAGTKVQELKVEAEKLGDELVAKGEMSVEEARKFVDDLIQQAQQPTVEQGGQTQENRQPRRIEILSDGDEETDNTAEEERATNDNIDNLRQKVQSLQDELRRLKND